MFCDVYFLRREGKKLAVGQFCVGARGHLRIKRGGLIVGERGVAPYRSYTAEVLTHEPHFPGQAAATLYSARVTKLDGRGFVITGTEVLRAGMGANTYQQAWFCKPVGEPECPMPDWAREDAK